MQKRATSFCLYSMTIRLLQHSQAGIFRTLYIKHTQPQSAWERAKK